MKNYTMQSYDTTVPVVILNAGLYDGLGILRSLGKLNIRAYVIGPPDDMPVFTSKYCAGKFLWDFGSESQESTLEFLAKVSSNFDCKPVLMYTNDEIMLFVQEHAEYLQEWFVFSRVRNNLAWKLYSKKEMYFLAREQGVPVPKSFFPRSRDELLTMVDQLPFPLLLKGVDGVLLDKREGRKMTAYNREELLRNYSVMEDPSVPNVIIQEYIPRDDRAYWIFDGYFNESSECLAAFTGKKFRHYPPHFGMTTYGMTQWNETLASISKCFLSAVGYCGVVGMDYCYDIRDRQYKIVDANLRIAANFRLFVSTNGVDVAQAQYLDLTGQTVPQTNCPDGRKWVVEDKDLLASYHYFREGNLTFWSWLRSLRGIHELGYFDMHDQKPFWRMVWNHCKRKIAKFWKQQNREAMEAAGEQPLVAETYGSGSLNQKVRQRVKQ